MNKQRVIFAEEAKKALCPDYANAAQLIDEVPTVDLESLPLVKALKEIISQRVLYGERLRKEIRELQKRLAECEPVVHAHWEMLEVSEKGVLALVPFKCSNCGRLTVARADNVYERFPYCNCGAKMDEEEAK